jgi:hypothetical protein
MMAPIAELVRELRRESDYDTTADMARPNLGRRASDKLDNLVASFGFTLQSVEDEKLQAQYEAALTDPRRI